MRGREGEGGREGKGERKYFLCLWVLLVKHFKPFQMEQIFMLKLFIPKVTFSKYSFSREREREDIFKRNENKWKKR